MVQILNDFALTWSFGRFPAWLPGRHGSRLWSEHGAAAATAMLDVAAPSVSPPASGLRRRPYHSPPRGSRAACWSARRSTSGNKAAAASEASRGSRPGEVLTVIGAGCGEIDEPDVWSPLIRRGGSSLSIPPDERSRVPLRRSKHVLCSLHCLERRDRRLFSTYRNRVHCIGWS